MKRALLLAFPLALTAATPESNVSLRHGQWELTTRVTNIEFPGMPEERAAEMRETMLSQWQTQQRCITREEAANPAANLTDPNRGTENCAFSREVFSGGTINIASTCPGPDGSTTQSTVSGTYAATEVNAEFTAMIENGLQPMRMRGTLTGRHTGECERQGG